MLSHLFDCGVPHVRMECSGWPGLVKLKLNIPSLKRPPCAGKFAARLGATMLHTSNRTTDHPKTSSTAHDVTWNASMRVLSPTGEPCNAIKRTLLCCPKHKNLSKHRRLFSDGVQLIDGFALWIRKTASTEKLAQRHELQTLLYTKDAS